jgi:prephenate dehydrogenase
VLPPEVHDRAVALTSHTPQVVASLMAARLAGADEELVSVSGQGLRDVVRIAASDPRLWSDILTTNATAVVPVLVDLQQDLAGVTAALSGSLADPTAFDDDELVTVLARGKSGAGRLPAKHGGAATDYLTVPVIVEDAPGSLGRLFLAAGEAGINLEDVRIEHTVGRLTAIAHLSVLPAVAGDLRSALAGGGWRVTG